jgi:hypothetical protein
MWKLRKRSLWQLKSIKSRMTKSELNTFDKLDNRREKVMHYKNGREAKNGDKVVLISEYGDAVIGILYDAKAGNDYCNGKLAPIAPNNPCPNLNECYHLDDVKQGINFLSKSMASPLYKKS